MELSASYISMAITAVISVAIYTYLYRENPAFRMAEHIIIGSITGHGLVMAVKQIYESGIIRVLDGDLSFVIPILLGVSLFFRWSPYKWVTRYPLAILIGASAGTVTRGIFHAWIIVPVIETISAPLNNLNNLVIFLGVLVVLIYFSFIIKPSTPYNAVSRVGRLLLLLTFGMTIAMDFLSRTGSVIARFDWLFSNVPYVTIASAGIAIAFMIYDNFMKKT